MIGGSTRMVPTTSSESPDVSIHHNARLPITAIILTLNEEANLESCLRSLNDWVEAIFIIDSGSTDQTVAIARRFGAFVMTHPFESHTRQWAWGLTQLPGHSDWVLALDADQRITSELREELFRIFGDGSHPEGVQGIYIKRRQVFRGRWIKHGGYYPKYLLKLFRRRGCVLDERELVDHHFYVKGPTLKASNDIIEENHNENDIGFWISKHVRYAKRMAEETVNRDRCRGGLLLRPRLFGNPDERTTWLKYAWAHLPLYVRPTLYFLYRYFFRLGFLVGKEGFIFHFLQAWWFRLLVDINQEDLRRQEG